MALNNIEELYRSVLFKAINGTLTFIRVPREIEDIQSYLEAQFGPVQIISIGN